MRSLLWALLAVACAAPVPPSAPAPAAPTPASTPVALPTVAAPLSWVERVQGGAATDRLPMLVLLHGLGDTPEDFLKVGSLTSRPVRVVALRPPLPYHDGFAWFPPEGPGDGNAEAVRGAADLVSQTLTALVASRPTTGKPVLLGFSQGAAVSYAMVALHPDQLAAAFPVAGWLPSSLLPASMPKPGPAVLALHGDADSRVAIALGLAAVGGLQRAGADAHLDPFPGTDHTISPDMRAALRSALDELLPR